MQNLHMFRRNVFTPEEIEQTELLAHQEYTLLKKIKSALINSLQSHMVKENMQTTEVMKKKV